MYSAKASLRAARLGFGLRPCPTIHRYGELVRNQTTMMASMKVACLPGFSKVGRQAFPPCWVKGTSQRPQPVLEQFRWLSANKTVKFKDPSQCPWMRPARLVAGSRRKCLSGPWRKRLRSIAAVCRNIKSVTRLMKKAKLKSESSKHLADLEVSLASLIAELEQLYALSAIKVAKVLHSAMSGLARDQKVEAYELSSLLTYTYNLDGGRFGCHQRPASCHTLPTGDYTSRIHSKGMRGIRDMTTVVDNIRCLSRLKDKADMQNESQELVADLTTSLQSLYDELVQLCSLPGGKKQQVADLLSSAMSDVARDQQAELDELSSLLAYTYNLADERFETLNLNVDEGLQVSVIKGWVKTLEELSSEALQFASAVLEANTDLHFNKMEELRSTHSILEADERMASDMLVLPALTLPAAAVLVPWLLAACGDIESNPGPDWKSLTREELIALLRKGAEHDEQEQRELGGLQIFIMDILPKADLEKLDPKSLPREAWTWIRMKKIEVQGDGNDAGVLGNAKEQLLRHLMPERLENIPSLKELNDMFTTFSPLYKVPVSHGTYQRLKGTSAADLVVAVPESPLTEITNFLISQLEAPPGSKSEAPVTTMIQTIINALIKLFRGHGNCDNVFDWEALYNETEPADCTSVRSTVMKTRLDTLIIASSKRFIVLYGEDKKAGGREAVERDLKTKLLHLPLLYMGKDLAYHLAYTAVGSVVCFWAVIFRQSEGPNQQPRAQLIKLGPDFNLRYPDHIAKLIINFAKIARACNNSINKGSFDQQLPASAIGSGQQLLYNVMAVIERTVPDTEAVFPHNTTKEVKSSQGWTTKLVFGLSEAAKSITYFDLFTKFHHTTLATLKKAYKAARDAANQQQAKGKEPFMIYSDQDPKQKRDACKIQVYSVQTRPLGYTFVGLLTEQEVKQIAAACCLTAQVLHAVGLVYKDWRRDNIAKLVSGKGYLVLDLESVSTAGTQFGNDRHNWLACWKVDTLDGGKFTHASDMSLIGHLIESYLDEVEQMSTQNVTREARAWVGLLKSKRTTAGGALEHEWLKEYDATLTPSTSSA